MVQVVRIKIKVTLQDGRKSTRLRGDNTILYGNFMLQNNHHKELDHLERDALIFQQ